MQNHRVLIVILEHLAADTGIAQLAQLDFIKTQKAKQHVLNVSKENCLKTSKLLAAGATWVNSAVKRVNVPIVQQDDTKTAKEKHRAKTVTWILT